MNCGKLILSCCILLASFNLPAQDLYNYENSLLFANYLFKTKQYDYAAREYERLVFMDSENHLLNLSLITTYEKGSHYAYGITRAEELYPDKSSMPKPFALVYTKLLLFNKSYNKARGFLSINTSLPSDEEILLNITVELYSNNWAEASNLYDVSSNKSSPLFKQYKSIIDETMNLKYKSPALATLMSAMIPGSGKFYTRDWKDGLMGFVFVAGSAWAAYRGFDKEGINSPYGWIFGSIAFGFYSGNLYGSYKSAKIYNLNLRKKIHTKVEDLYINNF